MNPTMEIFVLIMLLLLLFLLLFVAVFLKRGHKKIMEEQPERHDLATLEKHVRKLEHQGYVKKAIIKKLSGAGWEEHLIDLVIFEVHKPHNRLKALEEYVEQQILKAKPKEMLSIIYGVI